MKKRAKQTYNYEVLNYEAVVELLDTEGHEAAYTRHERIRFLQDDVSILDDYGWGNGIAFAGHEVYPGEFVKREMAGSRLRSTVRLPQRYSEGDELTFSVERTIRNGFVSPSECWLEAELYHEVRRVLLRVILPAGRPIRAARLVLPGLAGSEELEVVRLPDGRHSISYEDKDPAQGRRYTLLWQW